MNRLSFADHGQEQLDGLTTHDVTIGRGWIQERPCWTARCSGCTWMVAGPHKAVRDAAAHHERTGA